MSALRFLIFVAPLVVLEGCSPPSDTTGFVATAPPIASGAAVSGEYRLSPGDLLDISVFQVPDLTKEVQIDAAGQISLPLIGEINAAGDTSQALETEIAAKLRAKYLQSPQVSVFVKNAAGQQVTVTGAVNRPGLYPIVGQMTLIQALAQSGDLSDIGDPDSVRVFRQANGGRTVAKFNIDDIRSGKAADPNLHAGDMVVVDVSGTRNAWKNTVAIVSPVVGPASLAATVVH
jgi:polysaccharide export outer membrane protein